MTIWPVFLGAVGREGGSSGRKRAARWVVWWGGGRRDVSVVMALALSGADSALRWRISRLSAFIFSLMVVKILRAIN